MTAYVISDVGVVAPEDEPAWKAYVASVPATIEKYSGRYLVRDGAIDVMEGHWSPRAIVIVEFPNRETAAQWYSSPEYAAALSIRKRSELYRGLICVEGTAGPSSGNLLGMKSAE